MKLRARLACLVVVVIAASRAIAADDPPKWADIRSFAYQLQNADLDAIGKTTFQLAVIDYSADGSAERRYTTAQIAALQHSPGGAKRVLAYLSIGEAENYRFYWHKDWRPGVPVWLGSENPEWKGNFKVRYWDPAWQKIAIEYLDKIIDAGFDGVYLDCVDSFEYWGPDGESKLNRASAQRDMADFVLAIGAHARRERGKADFAVFPQNGEALERFADYVEAVTGIGREDVFFNGNKRCKGRDVNEVTRYLDQFLQAKKLVLTIDYPTRDELIEEDYRLASTKGYVPCVTVRALDRLVVHPGHDPGSTTRPSSNPSHSRRTK
jgi:cysteinyl-tRNA synthetase